MKVVEFDHPATCRPRLARSAASIPRSRPSTSSLDCWLDRHDRNLPISVALADAARWEIEALEGLDRADRHRRLATADALTAAARWEDEAIQALNRAEDVVYGDGAAILEMMAYERRQVRVNTAPTGGVFAGVPIFRGRL